MFIYSTTKKKFRARSKFIFFNIKVNKKMNFLIKFSAATSKTYICIYISLSFSSKTCSFLFYANLFYGKFIGIYDLILLVVFVVVVFVIKLKFI